MSGLLPKGVILGEARKWLKSSEASDQLRVGAMDIDVKLATIDKAGLDTLLDA